MERIATGPQQARIPRIRVDRPPSPHPPDPDPPATTGPPLADSGTIGGAVTSGAGATATSRMDDTALPLASETVTVKA